MQISAGVATAAIRCNYKEGIFAFFILAVIIVIVIFWMELHEQRSKISTPPGEKLFMDNDTINLNERLTNEQKRDILSILSGAAKDIAETLGISIELVRSNLFGVGSDGIMRMLQGLTFNMNREEELTISMPVGYGSTGRCFKNRKPNIAIFREGWGENIIEGDELSKVHPDLQWIISVPIPPGGDKKHPVWVLNVDGLKQRFGEEKLREALRPLFYWSQMIYLLIKSLAANPGEEK